MKKTTTKNRTAFISLALLPLFLLLVPSAFACIWYVDGVNGNDDNDCKTLQTACKTIGHAISLAKPRNTIRVSPATYTENLTISKSLNIIGSDAATTIVDGGGVGTTIAVSSTAQVALSKLTIRNGRSADNGGGIYNSGMLTINKSTISGNFAQNNGGGIFNLSSLTIHRSTISGNRTSEQFYWSYGGGIWSNIGTRTTINNSTISGNAALGFLPSYGGGICNYGTLDINNSTISGNWAANGDGGNIISFYGQPTTLQNSIVGGSCSGTIISAGYNLSSDNSCNFNGPGDMNNTDPKLGPLQNNGGPTQTMKLLPGSPAIDAGNPSGCTDSNGNLLTTDQRGRPRPGKEDTGGCDIGAFERQID